MTKSVPKVAVITRTKDRAVFLERALQSVHGQTYTDFVHVIYNDGGDKNVVEELLDRYATLTGDRVKLIHGAVSEGKEDSLLNRAVEASDSTYVAIHDDDDTWHPEFLERMVAVLDGGAYGVVARTEKIVEELDETARTIRELKRSPWMEDLKVVNLYRQCIDNQMTPITFMYQRQVFKELNGYDDELAVCGDWDFGIRFLTRYDVEYLDPGFPLAFYHHRRFKQGAVGNTSAAGNDRHRYYTNKMMNKYLRQELQEGRLGVGYIMSKLRYNESSLARSVRKIMPGFVAERLKRRVQR